MITNPMLPVAIILPVLIVVFLLFCFGAIRYNTGIFRRAGSIILAALICLCTFFINLRIMKYNPDAEYSRPNLDVLFVVDTSISMWAKDYGNDVRMTGAEETCNYIMDKLKGSSFSLITFNDKSTIQMPLTQDYQSVSDALNAIVEPSQYIARGSSLNSPYDDMKRMLEHMGQEEGHSSVIFFISDGEITNEEALCSYSELSGMIDEGAVLGFGTKEGAQMRDLNGNKVWDNTSSGYAISYMDETNLNQIASDLGVSYIHVTDKTEVDAVIESALMNSENVTDTRDGIENYDDTYYYLVPVLIILLLCEIIISRPAYF